VNVLLVTVWPFTVTEKGPDTEPEGTLETMLVLLHDATGTVVPESATVLAPWVVPKPDPEMVTKVPMLPEVGEIPLIFSADVTVKYWPLLAPPPTVTTTYPVVAPTGTGTTIDVADQLVAVAAVPLKVTVLAPWLVPKPVPAIVTGVPTVPEDGFKLVTLGVGNTVKLTPLLATPLTVTTTFPVVAPVGTGTVIVASVQLDGAASTPLKVTALVPCAAWNPDP
jgi:hypothetical protein